MAKQTKNTTPAHTPADTPKETRAIVAPASRIPPPANVSFAPHKHPDYPDGPDLDPMFGERTPAFVEWLEARKTPASEA